MQRRNKISGQWSPRLIEMLRSPPYRALSLSAHRVISRIEIELADHGGNNNGALPVTKQDFIEYGIDHNSIAPAIREAEALGFIKVTQRGRGGNAEHRKPNMFRLTFAHDRNSRQEPPTHDWRKIKTLDEAIQIASSARSGNRNRYGEIGPKPVRGNRSENGKSPVRDYRSTGPVRKPVPLSISRVGGRAERAVGRLALGPSRPRH